MFAGRERRRRKVGVGHDGEAARLMDKTKRAAGSGGGFIFFL